MFENHTPTCEKCGTKNKIVHSGIDAFLLGVDVATMCYECASWSTQNSHR